MRETIRPGSFSVHLCTLPSLEGKNGVGFPAALISLVTCLENANGSGTLMDYVGMLS